MVGAASTETDANLLAIPPQFVDVWRSNYKSGYQFAISFYRNHFEELVKTINAIALWLWIKE